MKTLRNVILLLLIAASTTAFAQRCGNARNPENQAEIMTQHMQTELNLTADQLTPVKDINLEFAQNLEQVRNANRGNQTVINEERQKLHDARMAKLKNVLTTGQMEKYENLHQNRGNRQGNQRGRRQGRRW